MRKESAIESQNVSRVVTARARRMVRDYVASLQSDTDLLKDGPSLSKRMFGVGVDVIPAFLELLESPNIRDRMIIAGLLPSMTAAYPALIPENARHRADKIFVDVLSGKDDMRKREVCCMLLVSGAVPVPEEAVLSLRRLLKSSDSFLAVLSAAVLARWNSEELEAVRLLKTTLHGDNDLWAGISGAALLRLGVQHGESMRAVQERLSVLCVEGQCGILRAARDIGPDCMMLFDTVVGILKDRKASPLVRQMAAHTLGSMAHGTNKVEAVLMKMLQSPNWMVIVGALQGLEISGHLPSEVVDHMIPLLTHAEHEMRDTGAMGIWMMKDRAAAAVPVLIRQLRNEPNAEVCEAFTKALAAIGEAAVPSLVSFMQEEYTANMVYALEALASTGPSAVMRVAELLPKVCDERIRRMLLMVLAGIGRHAEPALPVLANFLDEEDDDDLVLYAVMAIHHCGARAAPAIPALIRRIADRGCDDEIGRCALLALLSLPEEALPAIQGFLVEAQGETHEHLTYALAQLARDGGSRTSEFDHVNRDDLERFVLAGDILDKHQEPMGWRAVAEELKRLAASGEITLRDYGTSPRILSIVFKKLGDRWKTRLTTHTNQRMGALTDDGRRLLEQARLHLSRTHAQGDAGRSNQSR